MHPDPGPAPISEYELAHILEDAPDAEADFSEELHHAVPHGAGWSAADRASLQRINLALTAFFSAICAAMLCCVTDPWQVVAGIAVAGVAALMLYARSESRGARRP